MSNCEYDPGPSEQIVLNASSNVATPRFDAMSVLISARWSDLIMNGNPAGNMNLATSSRPPMAFLVTSLHQADGPTRPMTMGFLSTKRALGTTGILRSNNRGRGQDAVRQVFVCVGVCLFYFVLKLFCFASCSLWCFFSCTWIVWLVRTR